MTTATVETDALLSEIQTERGAMQKALGAMLDVRDIPGQWTPRQKDEYEERRLRLSKFIHLLGQHAERLAKAIATRNTLTTKRDRLRAARATIAALVTNAPDVRTIADGREHQQEVARQNGLHASLAAIAAGVPFVNGQPALPNPLRELLTDTCAHCGHAELKWPGPLGPLEEDLDQAESVIVIAPATLAWFRTSVAPYLAEVAG